MMVVRGHIRNGVVVLDEATQLPEGAVVQVEVIADSGDGNQGGQRQGGQWNGQVDIAHDFDDLPDDLAKAFGIKVS